MDILEKAYKNVQHYGVILCSRKHEEAFAGATEAPAGRGCEAPAERHGPAEHRADAGEQVRHIPATTGVSSSSGGGVSQGRPVGIE